MKHIQQIKTSLLAIILFSRALTIFAQESSPELITDRPDQTESSAVVPLNSLQVESGFIYSFDNTNLYNQKSFAYNTTLLRFGILENFELRLGLEFLSDKYSYLDNLLNSVSKGISPLHTGFKVKIVDENKFFPEIAFLGGLSLPFTAGDDYKTSNPAPAFRFAFAHTLSSKLSLGYNLGIELDGETALPGYFYSLALGISVTEKLGMFIENYGILIDDNNTEHLFDAGFTYLILPWLQADLSGGIGLNDTPMDQFISIGITARFD